MLGWMRNRLIPEDVGGVGVIWKSSLPVNNVQIDSDRMIAVQVNVSNSVTLSIVGYTFQPQIPL